MLLFVVAYPSDTRLPTTLLNTNSQLFNSNVTILGQHTSACHFGRSSKKKQNKVAPFQMHNVTYCKALPVWDSGKGVRRALTSENELHEGAGARVTSKIFGLMLSIFRPSTALAAAVRFEASVTNYPFTGQCCEQLSFSPDRELRRCLLSHLYQNIRRALHHHPTPPNPPTPCPLRTPSVYRHRD